jgi:hypothetical protein
MYVGDLLLNLQQAMAQELLVVLEPELPVQ